jgi:hypothetical protein
MAALASVLLLLSAALAGAAEPCAVELVPDAAGPGWDAEVKTLERALSTSRSSDADCRSIVIDARGGSVTVTTRDGRRATRALSRPEDVQPVVGALVTTVEMPEITGEAPPIAAPQPRQLRLALLGGGEVARTQFSPSLSTALSLVRGHLEVGLFGAWELGYRDADAEIVPRSLWAWRAGALLGGRWAPGSWELVAGGKVSAARFAWKAVNEDATDAQGMMESGPAGWWIDPRAGAYVGAAWPARAPLRLRVELGVEASAASLLGRAPPSLSPVLPAWGVNLGLGVESRLP